MLSFCNFSSIILGILFVVRFPSGSSESCDPSVNLLTNDTALILKGVNRFPVDVDLVAAGHEVFFRDPSLSKAVFVSKDNFKIKVDLPSYEDAAVVIISERQKYLYNRKYVVMIRSPGEKWKYTAHLAYVHHKARKDPVLEWEAFNEEIAYPLETSRDFFSAFVPNSVGTNYWVSYENHSEIFRMPSHRFRREVDQYSPRKMVLYEPEFEIISPKSNTPNRNVIPGAPDCSYTCTTPGKFSFPGNCNKYVQCMKFDDKWYLYTYSCRVNEYFKDDRRKCTVGEPYTGLKCSNPAYIQQLCPDRVIGDPKPKKTTKAPTKRTTLKSATFAPIPNTVKPKPPARINADKTRTKSVRLIPSDGCFFNCSTPGLFTYPGNCYQYYQCIKSDDNWYLYTYACPPDTYFNDRMRKCTVGEATTVGGLKCSNKDYIQKQCPSKFAGQAKQPKPTAKRTTPKHPTQSVSTPFPTMAIQPKNVTTIAAKQKAKNVKGPDNCQYECSATGLFAYPGNCYKYYQCIQSEDKWYLYTYDCGSGLYFNNHQRKCVIGEPIVGLKCSNPDYIKELCSPKAMDRKNTTSLKIAIMKFAPKSPSQYFSTTPRPVVGTKRVKLATNPKKSPSKKVLASEDGCFYNCTSTGLFPYPGNCYQYYQCMKLDDKWYLYTYGCPEDTYFNDNQRKCLEGKPFAGLKCLSTGYIKKLCSRNSSLEAKVKHTTPKPTKQPTSQTHKPDQPSKSMGSLTLKPTKRPLKANPIGNLTCNYECSSVGLFAYPGNCYQYYQCMKLDDNWYLYTYPCPPESYFNDAERKCVAGLPFAGLKCLNKDYIKKLCSNSSVVTKHNTTSKPITTSKIPTDLVLNTTPVANLLLQSTNRTTKRPLKPNPVGNLTCSYECSSAGLFAYPGNCYQYYQCMKLDDNWYLYTYPCPPESYFNDAERKCVTGQPVTGLKCLNKDYIKKLCSNSSVTKHNTTSKPIIKQTINQAVSDPVLNTTPVPNLPVKSLNHTTKRLLKPNPVGNSTCNYECSSAGLFAYPGNCYQYYQCMKLDDNWYLYTYPCPPESYFNDAERKCVGGEPFAGLKCLNKDYIKKLCSNSSVVTKHNTTSKPINTQKIPVTEPVLNVTSTATPSKSVQVTKKPHVKLHRGKSGDDGCRYNCSAPGLFPYPGNCYKYYQCIKSDEKWYLYTYDCLSDDYFNDDQRKCIAGDPFPGLKCSNADYIKLLCTNETVKPSAKKVATKPTIVLTLKPTSTETTTKQSIIPKTQDPSHLSENLHFEPLSSVADGCNYNCSESGLFAYPGNCFKYYQCIYHEKWYRYTDACPRGTYFNDDKRKCIDGRPTPGLQCSDSDYIRELCSKKPTPHPTTIPKSYPAIIADEPSCIDDGVDQEDESLNFICSNETLGYYALNGSCHSFMFCRHWNGTYLLRNYECRASIGKYFDERTRLCAEGTVPSNASCRQSPPRKSRYYDTTIRPTVTGFSDKECAHLGAEGNYTLANRCDWYVVCRKEFRQNGDPWLNLYFQWCPAGTYWHPDIAQCGPGGLPGNCIAENPELRPWYVRPNSCGGKRVRRQIDMNDEMNNLEQHEPGHYFSGKRAHDSYLKISEESLFKNKPQSSKHSYPMHGQSIFDDEMLPYTGFTRCKILNPSMKDELEKGKGKYLSNARVLDFLLETLRVQCDKMISLKTHRLWTDGLITRNWMTAVEFSVDWHHNLFHKPLLSPSEWSDLMSSLFLAAYSETTEEIYYSLQPSDGKYEEWRMLSTSVLTFESLVRKVWHMREGIPQHEVKLRHSLQTVIRQWIHVFNDPEGLHKHVCQDCIYDHENTERDVQVLYSLYDSISQKFC